MSNITSEDVKFYLGLLTVVTIFWKTAAWATRKQVGVESFFTDTRLFMKHTTGTLHRMETNHMAHQEKYLKHIATAVGADLSEDKPDAV